MNRLDKAIAAANAEVAELFGQQRQLDGFRVLKFGRHRDGWFHAQVSLNGETFYTHRRFGSWLMPRDQTEPTSRHLREVLMPFKGVLAEYAATFEARERAIQIQEEKDAKRRADLAGQAEDAGRSDPVGASV